MDKQVEYQRQILEFIAEQKEYRVSSLVESKREKLKNKTVEEFKKYYPFNEFKISKFDTSTKKRAVSKEDVMKIVKAGLEQATYWRILARDVFMFSYLSGGISFTDIANLTMDNIDRGRLLYSRQKTHGAIDFKINSNALDLIDKYAYHRKKAIYLFPILDANVHKTPLQKKNRIHKILGRVNKELKALAFE
ncbi:hypothetical protein [Gabonibacter massiliensis]|uniref:hypothetical protein n=1 Tax=Gabonibacter massiliensis TaxID=1720195 RepID=UPI00073EFAAB|nr:hypothetical protein [Gabonibacter massiliensis]